jgi:hypothetical protein
MLLLSPNPQIPFSANWWRKGFFLSYIFAIQFWLGIDLIQ